MQNTDCLRWFLSDSFSCACQKLVFGAPITCFNVLQSKLTLICRLRSILIRLSVSLLNSTGFLCSVIVSVDGQIHLIPVFSCDLCHLPQNPTCFQWECRNPQTAVIRGGRTLVSEWGCWCWPVTWCCAFGSSKTMEGCRQEQRHRKGSPGESCSLPESQTVTSWDVLYDCWGVVSVLRGVQSH